MDLFSLTAERLSDAEAKPHVAKKRKTLTLSQIPNLATCLIMSLSVVPSPLAFYQGSDNHDILESDIDALLDVEEIFSSVFSPCFEDHNDNVCGVTATDFMSPLPSSMHYATPVSPTASCAELVNVGTVSGNTDHLSMCEPTPLRDIMGSIPEFPQSMNASNNQGQKRAVSPVQKTKSQRPTKKRRGETSSPSKQVSSASEKEDDVLEQTRERNREHARKSRLRKKELTTNLQRSLEELKAENEKLRNCVMQKLGQKQTESLIRERRNTPPVEDFIAALKQPSNRIVDNNALDFLASLREEVVSSMEAKHASEDDDDDEKYDDFEAFYMIG